MRQIYVKDIINVVEGTLLCGSEECEITDIQTDSRQVKQGDLFVALIGEKEDGHKYLKSAVQQCSACFTMEHDQAEEWMEQSGACVIRVEDTLTAILHKKAVSVADRWRDGKCGKDDYKGDDCDSSWQWQKGI